MLLQAPLLLIPLCAVAMTVYLFTGDLPLSGLIGVVASAAAATSVLASRPLTSRVRALASAARQIQAELPSRPDGEPPASTRKPRTLEGMATQVRELQRQLTILVSVMDGMADGIWLTNSEGLIIRHNDALKELLFAGQDLIGKSPIELLRSAELQQAVSQACKHEQASRLELSLDGLLPRTVTIQIAPLAREVGGSVAVFHDVSELRRLEKVRKDFVANVSHELRTPITAIRGYAETLRSGALQDTGNAPQMVEIIHRQSERLSELVEDLLELSRLEAKEVNLKREPVSLALAATRAADAVRPKAASKGIRLVLQLPEQLQALGDDRAIEQVLLNLLDNAVKYTPAGGSVEVTGRLEGTRAEVDVHDTGLGIEPKHLPRIFERFYRVDKGRSREMGGTGLGLSIVKHLVTAMEGDVKVISETGRGTHFTVFLPGVAHQTAVTG